MESTVLDFRTKFLLLITVSTIAISANIQQAPILFALTVYMLPIVLLLMNGKYKTVIKGVLVFILAQLIYQQVMKMEMGAIVSLGMFFVFFVLKMLPGAMMGYYILLTTRMSDMVASLQKLHVPDFIIIPLSVMFRFFYSVREDYQLIKDAMKLHGLLGAKMFLKPVAMMEYRLVPLLMCSTKAADDVAISAMTRGLRVNQQRSTISLAKLRVQDYLFFVLMFLMWMYYFRLLAR